MPLKTGNLFSHTTLRLCVCVCVLQPSCADSGPLMKQNQQQHNGLDDGHDVDETDDDEGWDEGFKQRRQAEGRDTWPDASEWGASQQHKSCLSGMTGGQGCGAGVTLV